MGASSSKKLAAKCTFLSKEEQIIIGNAFRVIGKNSEKLKEDELMKCWGSHVDPRLCQYISNYLFGRGASKTPTVDFEKFAELFVYCTRGTVDEKLKVIVQCLDSEGPNTEEIISHLLIKEYVESIVSSYLKLQRIGHAKQFTSWSLHGSHVSSQNVQRLAESLTSHLAGSDAASVTQKNLETWLQCSTLLGQLLLSVFIHLYTVSHREKTSSSAVHSPEHSNEDSSISSLGDKSLVPFCKGLDLIPSYPSLLDLSQIVFINAHLPQQYQLEWRFLFSSEIHGESFSTLIGRIVDQGPSVLIVKDQNGHIFGAFAPASWTIGPQYFGDDSSFLFTLVPKMSVFPTTGYNQHFQYLNLHQQTMPNGLGMGGQHGYCGLWLGQEYGHGHTSESCTTYAGYYQMSSVKEFKFQHLEVWGLGSPPVPPQERGERSNRTILSGNEDGKMLLKMSGRNIHSEGFTETQ